MRNLTLLFAVSLILGACSDSVPTAPVMEAASGSGWSQSVQPGQAPMAVWQCVTEIGVAIGRPFLVQTGRETAGNAAATVVVPVEDRGGTVGRVLCTGVGGEQDVERLRSSLDAPGTQRRRTAPMGALQALVEREGETTLLRGAISHAESMCYLSGDVWVCEPIIVDGSSCSYPWSDRNEAGTCECLYGGDYPYCQPYDYYGGDGSGGSGGGSGGGSTGGTGGGSGGYEYATAPNGIDQGWYDTLSREEKILCWNSFAAAGAAGVTNPGSTECGRYYAASQAALDWATAQENEGLLEGCWNGPCDAARHAYWSGLLTQMMGASRAEVWTNAHETGSGYDPVESPMDLHNNAIGRSLASATELGAAVMQQVNSSNGSPPGLVWLSSS